MPDILCFHFSSQNRINVNQWHEIRVTQHHRKATLQLDDGPIEVGESSVIKQFSKVRLEINYILY